MDEQNRYPHEPDGPGGRHDDYTRPLPPYEPDPGRSALPPVVGPFYGTTEGPSAANTTATAPRRHGLTAAVLAGALVLGGAAGVGGAAAYHAFSDDSSGTTSTSSSGPFQTTRNAVVQEGSVEKVANAVLPSVVKVNVSGQSESGSGSGIVLSKDGEILTNNHVVAVAGDSGSITVNFNDGTTKKATVVGTDPMTDIGVIKVSGVSDLVPAALGQSGSLRVGQSVVAVGSPYGLNATVTSGIVSALNRPVSVSTAEQPQQQDPFGGQGQQDPFGGQGSQPNQSPSAGSSTTYPAIQTDAAINPGNSGGPLVDLSGRVVGINSSIRTASAGGTGTDSGGSIGLGFAIPIDEILPVVNQISKGEAPTHARLGVSVSNITGDTLTQGAQLAAVENGGAAAKTGLKKGDVITRVDDEVITDSESLVATIRGHRPGDKVTVTYLRDGKSSTTSAVLGSDKNSKTS